MTAPHRLGPIVLGTLLALLFLVLVRTAWLCDDALISLRVADNVVHGHGLRWNTDERVQVFTHPLWLLLLSTVTACTGELYLTTLVLSIMLAAAGALLVVAGRKRSMVASATGLGVLLLSPSFIDYSTSGLENPLSHLLLAAFLAVWFGASPRRPAALALLAGLALVNRLDHLWLYAPALAHELVRARDRWTAGRMALGFAPCVAWYVFALVYYGFWMPNPAVAKLASGIGWQTTVRQGFLYCADFARYDPLSAAAIVAGVTVGYFWPPRRSGLRATPHDARVFAAGMLLYTAYLVAVGGDFMRGRFWTTPLLLAVGLLVRQSGIWRAPQLRFAPAAAALVLGFTAVRPTLVSGASYGAAADRVAYRRSHGIADERAVYFPRYGLLNGAPLASKPGHDMDALERWRASDSTRIRIVHAAGRSGLQAGPRAHLVDGFALCDPLLARLPILPGTPWRIGHFPREVPAGYLESIAAGQGEILDPHLREYATRLRRITRDPVLSAQRWRDIARVHRDGTAHGLRGFVPYEVLDGAECARVAADPARAGPEILWKAAVHHLEQGDFGQAERLLDRVERLPVEARIGTVLPDPAREIAAMAQVAARQGDGERAMRLAEFGRRRMR